MTTLETLQNAVITLREIKTYEYKLRYYYAGLWFTSETIIADSDYEAIFDADRAEKKASDKLVYALWRGNRVIKRY